MRHWLPVTLLLVALVGSAQILQTVAGAKPPAGSVAYANNGNASLNSGGSTSVAITLTGVTAGNCLVIGASWVDNTITVSSVSDSNGTMVDLVTQTSWSSGGAAARSWYVKNTASGSHTITINFSGTATFRNIIVDEFSGANTSTPIENPVITTGSGNGSSPLTLTTASMSVSGNNSMIWAFGNFATSGTIVAGTGYTLRSGSGNWRSETKAENAGSDTAVMTSTDAGNLSAAWFIGGTVVKP